VRHRIRRGLPVALAWLAGATLAHAGLPVVHETREPPPQRVPIDELNQIAAGHTDRVPPGFAFLPKLRTSALTWTFIGPQPVTGEYWSGNANASGRICCVLPHPTDPNVIYVAAAQGGVWKSVNGGGTWTPLTDQLSSLSSGWLAFDPANANVVYYATGEQHYAIDSYYGDGLFKTSDGGGTWTKIASKASVGGFIARVLVDPANSSRLFVASDLGIVRSIDGGTTWSIVWSGGSDAWGNDLVFDPSNSAVLYAAIYGVGVVKSTDGGDHWTVLAGGLPAAGTFQRVNLAIAPSNALVLYVSFVDPNQNLLGMYRTTNGGSSWTKKASTPNYLVGQGFYDNTLAVSPSDPNVCYAGGVFPYSGSDAGIIKTTNGGSSWTDVTIGSDGSQVHPDQHSLAFGPGGVLWVGCDGGVWKTTSGGSTWINCNATLAVTQFYEAAVRPDDPTQMIAGTQDQGTLLTQGSTAWPQLVEGDGGPCGYDPGNPDLAFTTSVFMQNLLRFDQYVFDVDVTGPWAGLGDRASFAMGPLTFDSNRASTMLAGTYRVWRSSNDGNTWSAISPDLTNGGYLRAIAICPGVPGSYYAASSDGVVSFTSDDGASWQRRSTGLPGAAVLRVVVQPGNSAVAYAISRELGGDRVFKTTNTGMTWSSITGNLPEGMSPHSIAVDFRPEPDQLYVGSEYGLWTSGDGGVTWIQDSSGLPNTTVFDLQMDLAHDLLVAATHGRGMWKATLGTSVAVEPTPSVRFALDPVRPQPVRASVGLQYHLPRAATVALELFDVRGRKVQVIDAGWREAGAHQARWEGTDAAGARVPSGIYFARLSLGTERSTQRLVLVH
jgi:photosystem II stability/assembly factor-like uncharacterized protein